MKAEKIFIVKQENSASVSIISTRTLVQNIKQSIQSENANIRIKQKDIESYASELMDEIFGRSLTDQEYEYVISVAHRAIVKYSQTTPYQFGKKYMGFYEIETNTNI